MANTHNEYELTQLTDSRLRSETQVSALGLKSIHPVEKLLNSLILADILDNSQVVAIISKTYTTTGVLLIDTLELLKKTQKMCSLDKECIFDSISEIPIRYDLYSDRLSLLLSPEFEVSNKFNSEKKIVPARCDILHNLRSNMISLSKSCKGKQFHSWGLQPAIQLLDDLVSSGKYSTDEILYLFMLDQKEIHDTTSQYWETYHSENAYFWIYFVILIITDSAKGEYVGDSCTSYEFRPELIEIMKSKVRELLHPSYTQKYSSLGYAFCVQGLMEYSTLEEVQEYLNHSKKSVNPNALLRILDDNPNLDFPTWKQIVLLLHAQNPNYVRLVIESKMLKQNFLLDPNLFIIAVNDIDLDCIFSNETIAIKHGHLFESQVTYVTSLIAICISFSDKILNYQSTHEPKVQAPEPQVPQYPQELSFLARMDQFVYRPHIYQILHDLISPNAVWQIP
jgi:hypothetical protein